MRALPKENDSVKKLIGILTHLWQAESARIMSVIVALAAAGLVPGTWGKVIAIVIPLIGGQAVRATVFSPLTVAKIRRGTKK
jgi:hypothetical protein